MFAAIRRASSLLAIGLNSRSAIRDWRGITNRISDAARELPSELRTRIEELAVRHAVRARPLFATGIGGLGLLGWRRKRKAQAVA